LWLFFDEEIWNSKIHNGVYATCVKATCVTLGVSIECGGTEY